LTEINNKPFEMLTSLTELRLNGNQLTEINNKLFEGLKNMTQLLIRTHSQILKLS